MTKLFQRLVLSVALCCAVLCHAAERPRVCLVLSGGGARGITHIGVLKALEEQHIPIDCIAGTSMGAIVGGLYAAGYSAAELEAVVRGLDWGSLFDDRLPRPELSQQRKGEDFDFPWSFELGYGKGGFSLPQSAVGGVGFERLLVTLAARAAMVDDFNRLPIPFRAVATDMVSGKLVVFERGPLARALRASMSVPGAFAPTEIDGHVLGDGGLVMNLPVDIARSMGADVVIAVNIGTPLAPKEALSNLVGVTQQMINILTEQNVRAQLGKLNDRDVLIAPRLETLTFLDFTRAAEGIPIGYAAAQVMAPRLQALALDDEQWRAYLATRQAPPPVSGRLAFVRIEGTERAKPDVLLADSAIRAGDAADEPTLQREAARLMGKGDFVRVEPRLVREDGQLGAVFDVQEKSWGPHLFRLGFSASSDFEGDAGFDLLLGHRLSWVNDWGAEWRNRLEIGRTRGLASELVQPLGSAGDLFIAPRVDISRRTLNQFDGDRQIAQWQGGFNRYGIDLGMPFGTWGEARLGLAHGRYIADQTIGALATQRISFDENGVTGSVVLDQLDSAAFPRQGWRVAGDFFNSRKTLGSLLDYTRLRLTAVAATSSGPSTWQAGLEYGGFFDRSRIGFSDFRLGGFQRLSGFRNEQVDGNYLAFGKLVYQHRLAEITPFGRAVYAGASLELGNAWANRDDMRWGDLHHAGSLFVAADTPLGPAYIAVGAAEGGHRALYLFFGRP